MNNKDKQLDIPAEANRDKHINFLEAEERTSSENRPGDKRFGHNDDDEKRREEWQRGLAEGEAEKNKKA